MVKKQHTNPSIVKEAAAILPSKGATKKEKREAAIILANHKNTKH